MPTYLCSALTSCPQVSQVALLCFVFLLQHHFIIVWALDNMRLLLVDISPCSVVSYNLCIVILLQESQLQACRLQGLLLTKAGAHGPVRLLPSTQVAGKRLACLCTAWLEAASGCQLSNWLVKAGLPPCSTASCSHRSLSSSRPWYSCTSQERR